MPTTAATTLRKGREHLVIDGPFAETRNSCLLLRGGMPGSGACDRDRRELARANDTGGSYEIAQFRSTTHRRDEVTDIAWIDTAITSARPQAIAALAALLPRSRHGGRSFQDACLRALRPGRRMGRRAIPLRG